MNIIDVRHSIPHSNYSRKVTKKIGIAYHITDDNKKYQCLRWFQNPIAKVSAHYIVEPDGVTHYCVDTSFKAYHAGVVKNPTAQIIKDRIGINPNEFLVGIEVVSNGNDLTPEQYVELYDLTEHITEKHKIILNRYHLIGHNEINSRDKYFCPIKAYHPNDIIRTIQLRRQHEDEISKKESSISSLRKRLKRFIESLRS